MDQENFLGKEAFFGMLTFMLFCLYGLTLHSFRFSAPYLNPTRPGGVNKLLTKNFLGKEAFFGMFTFMLFCLYGLSLHSFRFSAPYHNPTRPGGGSIKFQLTGAT